MAAAAQRGAHFVASRPDWVIDVLNRINTTNVRVLVTLGLAIGTAGRYLTHETWEPSLEWLGFLATMAGLDVTQWYAKRRTHKKYADDTEANGTAAPAPGGPDA